MTYNFTPLENWWSKSIFNRNKACLSQLFCQSMFYVMWNAWKERNRRIFNETTLTIVQRSFPCKEDIDKRLSRWIWSSQFPFLFSYFFLVPCNIFVLLFSMSICWNGQSTRFPRKFGIILVNSIGRLSANFVNYSFYARRYIHAFSL